MVNKIYIYYWWGSTKCRDSSLTGNFSGFLAISSNIFRVFVWLPYRYNNITRQSEMANTSPRHMPVLGSISRVFIFLIDRAKRFSWKIFEINIFEIYAIELLGSLPTDEAWRHLRCITFAYAVYWPTGSMYTNVVMIHWILQ